MKTDREFRIASQWSFLAGILVGLPLGVWAATCLWRLV